MKIMNCHVRKVHTQMYFGGSVIGEASAVSVEISLTPTLIFTRGGQKVRNLASFSTSLNFEPLTFENAAIYWNAETNFLCRNDRPMSSPTW